MMSPLLDVEDLTQSYRRSGETVAAVDGVSFEVGRGETFGLCGPSGSGKSTIARLILGLARPDSGRIVFMGEEWSDLTAHAVRQRRRHLQIVFQNPNAAFNPRATVSSVLTDPLRIHAIVPAMRRAREVDRLLERVGLPREIVGRHAHELSGGQRQRVAIARAIATGPQLIVLDEATASLDTSVRADILDLLIDLQRDLNVAYMLISHDIALIRSMSHRVAILDGGKIVETGEAAKVIDAPRSATGKALVAAVPRL